MRQSVFYSVGVALLALSSTAHAATIRFDTDPFAGYRRLDHARAANHRQRAVYDL